MVIYVGSRNAVQESGEAGTRGGRQVSLRRIDSSSRVKVMAANREIYGWRIYKSRGRRVNVERKYWSLCILYPLVINGTRSWRGGLVIDSTCRRKGRCNEGWSRMVRKWLRFSSLCAIYICGRSIFLETRINLKVEMLIFNCSTNMQIKKYICGIVFIFNGKNLIPLIYSFTIRLLLFKYSIIFRSWKCMNKIIQVSYVKGLCSRIQQRSSLKNSMRDFILCFFQNIKRFDEMCINY